jgi:hypothetical protein
LDQNRIKRYIVQIVMEIPTTPAMTRVAGHAYSWTAITPMTRAANVVAGRIGKKDVSALVSGLRAPFQSSTGGGESCEVSVVVDSHQHVGILRVTLVAGK